MTRKITAIITATLLMLALLPAGVAFAAADATARLVEGVEVFPENGQLFSIQVTNDEGVGGLLPGLPGPLGGSAGETIRAVSIALPAGDGIRIADTVDLAGWEVVRSDTTQVLRFLDGEIEPGESFEFPFLVNVAAPANGDREGFFDVRVSNDPQGATMRQVTDGGLTTLVRTLRLLDFLPVDPPLALSPNRDMTSTGEVVYRAVFENFAANSQDVTPTVTSNRAEDEVQNPGEVSIPAGGTLPGTLAVDFPITVNAPNDRDHTFSLDISSGSRIDAAQDVYRVLAPPSLDLDEGGFHPRVIQTHTARNWDFTIPTDKAGTPGLTFDSVTMEFDVNEISCTRPDFVRGNVSVELECSGGDLAGDTGEHDVTFTFVGVDDNGVLFEFTETLTDALRIDNILPLINFNNIGLPSGQVHAKSGDQVTVSGTIDPGAGGTDVEIDFIELRSTESDVVQVNVNQVGNEFSGTATLDFPDAAGTDDNTFRAIGQVRDEAGNIGGGNSPSVIFDDVLPLLPGEGLDVEVGRVIQEDQYGSNPVIEVQVIETHELDGGCNPALWHVHDNEVTNVLYSDGGQCGAATDPDDHIRILVLADDLDILETPSVEYDPQGGAFFDDLPLEELGLDALPLDEAAEQACDALSDLPIDQLCELFEGRLEDALRDGARNFSVQTVFDTIWEILPPLPQLIVANRNNGAEVAPLDEGSYWTRFDGNDLELTVRGIHTGWDVQILDGGTPIVTQEHTGGGNDITVNVPVGSVPDGSQQTFDFAVRFVNNIGAGDARDFTVTVDRILPTIADATRTASDTVSVNFSEKIWDGDENAIDWVVWEHRDDPDSEEDRYTYIADRVDGGRSDTWTLTVGGMRGEPFGGVEYDLVRPLGDRLQDRAGNRLLNTTG